MRDEATKDTAGAVNVVDSILRKIKQADIFIADISTTLSNGSSQNHRASPNPNAVFELGFAVSELGWDRIILLFNTALGNLKQDLPFDFRGNRVSTYYWAVGDGKDAQKKVQDLLSKAIETILDKDPKRTVQLIGKSEYEIKIERDIENIRWIMSTIHVPTLENFLENLPYEINDSIFHFFHCFKFFFDSFSFNLYNKKLYLIFKDFNYYWNVTLSFGYHYDATQNYKFYVLSKDNGYTNDEVQQDLSKIKKAASALRACLDKLIATIRSDYLEIDLDQTSAAAWEKYVAFQKK